MQLIKSCFHLHKASFSLYSNNLGNDQFKILEDEIFFFHSQDLQVQFSQCIMLKVRAFIIVIVSHLRVVQNRCLENIFPDISYSFQKQFTRKFWKNSKTLN